MYKLSWIRNQENPQKFDPNENYQTYCTYTITGVGPTTCVLILNPFTTKDAIWRPGVITYPEINLLIHHNF